MWLVRSHLSLPECSLKLKRWTITPQKESHIRLSALLEHLQQCLCLCQYDSICHLSEVPLGMTSSQACDTIDLSIINSLGCSWISSRKSLGSTTSLWKTGCFLWTDGKTRFLGETYHRCFVEISFQYLLGLRNAAFSLKYTDSLSICICQARCKKIYHSQFHGNSQFIP